MASTQFDSMPIGGHRQGSLSKTKGILIETMQLVEPRKEQYVPNHLLESRAFREGYTQIYSKVAQNGIVQARPAVLHFSGFEVGKTTSVKLDLANVSSQVQRMHIIPPQTKYFYIKYTKNERLVPGLTLECTVEFTPDECRYYYDCIRLHTKGEENLVIPIHAFPVMDASDFPSQVTFQPVPIGTLTKKIIPLRCHAPIDFEFELSILQHHPAFAVEPMAGIVPANDEVEITVTFSPTEFSTSIMKLQLVISQFNSKPLVCTFTGSSVPGLQKAIREQTETSDQLDPRCFSPLERARKNKKSQKTGRSSSSGSSYNTSQQPQEHEVDGIKFPVNLDTPYAVAQVLNQEPGKLRIKDLRDAVMAKQGKGKSAVPTRQMKEAVFEMAVRQNVYEERQNQLRWQVKVGDNQISQKARRDILAQREDSWNEYRRKRGDPDVEREYLRNCTQCTFRRTRRDKDNEAKEIAKFDTYTNNMWATRHTALSRFKQAARKILIRNRGHAHLKGLKQMMLDWGNNKYSTTVNAESMEKDAMEAEELNVIDELLLTPERVTSLTFPTYTAPNVKDDMAVDALGNVPVHGTEVVVKKKVPYCPLKVPQQSKLMGYKPHNVHDASKNYVPPKLLRPLRTGAEDEIIILPSTEKPQRSLSPERVTTKVKEPHAKPEVTPEPVSLPQQEIVPLVPPQALFRPIDYPPLHIFNPAPGVQVFQPPLPYAETNPDFHLCPIPRYTSKNSNNPHMATQKPYMDREDVIKGVMGWKRFPSQGLTSLANTPTLTNVWVPRWNDNFGTELLPTEVPPLFESLPDEDQANITEESEEDASVSLTPEMVNVQFSLIEGEVTPIEEKVKKEDFPMGNRMPVTNIPVSEVGPVPREKRERELEFFLKKKYNRLGGKIQNKMSTLNNLKTNPDLELK